jgi:hypothetical protein
MVGTAALCLVLLLTVAEPLAVQADGTKARKRG